MTPPPTVLMLHAYPLSSRMWSAQRPVLEAVGLKVLTPDLPGFGGRAGQISSLPSAARELLGILPDGEITLVGLSMGGYLAMELLAQAPQRFTRAVLADTTLRADPPEKQRDRHEQAERALREGTHFLIQSAQQDHTPGTFAQVRPMIEQATPAGVAAALRAMAARPDQRAALQALTLPVLALVGENDPVTPPERAQDIAQVTGGTLTVIPGAGHLSNLDHPQAFNAALLAFLSA